MQHPCLILLVVERPNQTFYFLDNICPASLGADPARLASRVGTAQGLWHGILLPLLMLAPLPSPQRLWEQGSLTF